MALSIWGLGFVFDQTNPFQTISKGFLIFLINSTGATNRTIDGDFIRFYDAQTFGDDQTGFLGKPDV